MTDPKSCTIMIPGLGPTMPPSHCEGRRFKAGRCREHYLDWRNTREAHAIEQREFRKKQIAANKVTKRGRVTPPVVARVGLQYVSTWIPKAERQARRRRVNRPIKPITKKAA